MWDVGFEMVDVKCMTGYGLRMTEKRGRKTGNGKSGYSFGEVLKKNIRLCPIEFIDRADPPSKLVQDSFLN